MLIFYAWAEITNKPKSKQITFHRGDYMYHRFASKKSNINEYQTRRQYLLCVSIFLIVSWELKPQKFEMVCVDTSDLKLCVIIY